MPTPLGLNSTAGPLTYSLYFFLSLTLTHKRFVRSPSYIKHNFFLDYVFLIFYFFGISSPPVQVWSQAKRDM